MKRTRTTTVTADIGLKPRRHVLHSRILKPETRQPEAIAKGDDVVPPYRPIAMQLSSMVPNEMLRGFAEQNLKTRPLIMARPDGFKGQKVALCGAGPSLRDADFGDCDMVFACNSALTYLVDEGVTVAAGVAIDQTPRMLEEWESAPDVLYFLASTCDPLLVKHLKDAGRQVIFFHNYTGFGDDEFEYYCEQWPPALMVGEGQTVVGRAVGLCEWLGFDRIDVFGADNALGLDDIAHADGTHVADAYRTPLVLTGEIDGRLWRTRADMLMAAVQLVRKARASNGRVRLMGDTLPVALLDKDDDFLDLVCRKLTPEEMAATPAVGV